MIYSFSSTMIVRLPRLTVLNELSAKTQVLFFTHHRHLVELAEASKLAAAITVQRL
jgi:uncharacterized protein YhaN